MGQEPGTSVLTPPIYLANSYQFSSPNLIIQSKTYHLVSEVFPEQLLVQREPFFSIVERAHEAVNRRGDRERRNHTQLERRREGV